MKIIFGASIVISAAAATLWGFSGLSDLLDFLIHSIPGRIIMFIIGASYLTIGLWKFFHLHRE